MSQLDARKRAGLPDRAFAYIDSRGRRRLPINDESHVRNALARFNQVTFEDDAARERARKRLLTAAKKYGIVPVGFITGQLQSERDRVYNKVQTALVDVAALPTGFVTLLMTDIEGSTDLLHRLGDRYRDLLKNFRGILRAAAVRAGGREIDARADEFFAVFKRASGSVEAAVAMQRAISEQTWPDNLEVRVRIGIHSGRPTLTDLGYIGLAVHTVARICSVARGGQIVISGKTREAIGTSAPEGMLYRNLGRHRLPGLADAETLFQIKGEGRHRSSPRQKTGRTLGRSSLRKS